MPHLQGAAQTVHHQGGKGLALNILGNDEQAAAFAGNGLQHGHEVLHVGNFLVGKEDVGIVQDGFHLVAVGHEVGADVAAVELHAFHHFDLGLGAFGLFHGDDAVLLHFGHGIGNELADMSVVVGGNGAHLLHLGVVVTHRLALGLEISDNGIPFDPTKAKEADVSLSVRQRSIGGLGIYLIRKYMDKMEESVLTAEHL